MTTFPFGDFDAWIKELISFGPQDPDPQSVTFPRRSVTVIDNQGNPIPDYPDYPAPRGMRWNRCEACREWFPSKRYHAKTCGTKCRKALSRKERA